MSQLTYAHHGRQFTDGAQLIHNNLVDEAGDMGRGIEHHRSSIVTAHRASEHSSFGQQFHVKGRRITYFEGLCGDIFCGAAGPGLQQIEAAVDGADVSAFKLPCILERSCWSSA